MLLCPNSHNRVDALLPDAEEHSVGNLRKMRDDHVARSAEAKVPFTEAQLEQYAIIALQDLRYTGQRGDDAVVGPTTHIVGEARLEGVPTITTAV